MLKHLRSTDNGFAKVVKENVSFSKMKRFQNDFEKEDYKRFKKNEYFKGNKKLYLEDTDDETLIRETHAALKNLSGNFSDVRSSLYKSNSNDEYSNNCEVKENDQNYEISSNFQDVLYPPSVKLTNHDIQEKNNKRFEIDTLKNVNKLSMSAFKPVQDDKRIEYPTDYDSTNIYCKEESEVLSFENNHAYKPIDSPDSKQYTILQPAGIGSRAASVLKDIARDGILSVSAVSNSNASVSDTVSSTTTNDSLREKESYQNKGNNCFRVKEINLYFILFQSI